jgi:hypothetical protein
MLGCVIASSQDQSRSPLALVQEYRAKNGFVTIASTKHASNSLCRRHQQQDDFLNGQAHFWA